MKTNYNNLFEQIDALLSETSEIKDMLKGLKNKKDDSRENLSLDDLILYLKDKGVTISKSKIYKLTSTCGGIPLRRYNRRLIFNIKEIDSWLESRFQRNFESSTNIIRATQRKIK